MEKTTKRYISPPKRGNSPVLGWRGKSGDGSDGSRQGLEYARSLACKSKGFTLIVVAGMDYASFVNSKGLRVIDDAEITVRTMLQ